MFNVHVLADVELVRVGASDRLVAFLPRPILIGTAIGIPVWFAEAVIRARFRREPLTQQRWIKAGARGGAAGAGIPSLALAAFPDGGLWPLLFVGAAIGGEHFSAHGRSHRFPFAGHRRHLLRCAEFIGRRALVGGAVD